MTDPSTLASATNDINDLLNEVKAAPSHAAGREKMILALLKSCQTLRDAAGNPLLNEYELALDAGGPEAIRTIMSDRQAFDRFLQAESALLIQSGLKQDVTELTIRDIRKNIKRYEADPTDSTTLRQSIAKLEFFVCRRADRLARHKQTGAIAKGLLNSFAGLTTVVVNIAYNEEFGVLYTAASLSIGGGLVKDGANVFSELFGDAVR